MAQADPDPATRIAELERENRTLARRLSRLAVNVGQMEDLQDSNAKLLSTLMVELEEERAKSERLLLNVLPRRVVDRLQAGETVIADRHEAVTVLFSDFVGFTSLSSDLPATVVVDELNRLFSAFDALCERNGVEKIKTIGDAYMAVGGLPETRPDHAVAIAETALGMIDVVDRSTGSRGEWRVRIGIHSGPCVAGVIGTRKFIYDVWGDTVNVASRLETSSLPGRVHLSAAVAGLLGDRFELEPREAIELKGKGRSQTYFLARRPASP
jgi:class 3 adenylate cyclase